MWTGRVLQLRVDDRITRKGYVEAMNAFLYEVVGIDGDYAHLRRIGEESENTGETKLVARALLPSEITEGTHLKYEWMQYEIAENQS
jgi:hypothetical protein